MGCMSKKPRLKISIPVIKNKINNINRYCKEQFGFDDKAYTFCADDYCGSCCD
jgi:hypothetical protein